MAKGKSFFGLKRGSTKSLTFQVLNGQQIVKDRVFEVKNPRTTSQMIQRMVMATATAAYSHMREICDHSFEGISFGQNSMSEFIRLNAAAILNDYKAENGDFSYNPYQDRHLYAGPYIVSKGSLSINRGLFNFDMTLSDGIEILYYQLPVDGEDTVDETFVKWGVKVGDYMTAIMLYNDTYENAYQFGWIRLHFIKGGTTAIGETELNTLIEIESNMSELDMEIDEGYLRVSVSSGLSSVEDIYGTYIISRKSNGKWLRSSSSIIFPGSAVNTPSAATALATYPTGNDYILNGAQL